MQRNGIERKPFSSLINQLVHIPVHNINHTRWLSYAIPAHLRPSELNKIPKKINNDEYRFHHPLR